VLFCCCGGGEHAGVSPEAADDLHADGQVVGETGGHRGGGMTGEVERVGQAPPDAGVDTDAVEHALLERLSGDEREDVIEAEEDTGDYERAVEDDSTLRYE
jgi:hypothetical protein